MIRMNKMRLLGLLTLLAAVALIVISLAQGESQVGLFLIFPFIYGGGITGIAGTVLVFLGFALLFFSISFSSSSEKDLDREDHETKSSVRGVVFIGPVPIIFGSGDRLWKDKWFVAALAVLVIFVIVLMALLFLR